MDIVFSSAVSIGVVRSILTVASWRLNEQNPRSLAQHVVIF